MKRAGLVAALALLGPGCGDDARVRQSGIVPGGDTGTAGEPAPEGAGGDNGNNGNNGMNSGVAGGPPPGPESVVTAAGFAKAPPCEDIFAPVLQTFSIDISVENWNAMHAEYVSVAMGTPGALEEHNSIRYPIVFHYGDEAKPATVRLKGESSWQSSYILDGDNGKMQFAVSFDDGDPRAKLHGVSSLALDMPPNDPTFLRSRIANSWLRAIGIPALCSTSARLFVNGDYYGLFTVQERAGSHFVREFFPDNAMGDLVKSGWKYETNESMPNGSRLHRFWGADTPHDLAAIVDIPRSLKSWAAEVVLNDGDGYWGGGHNFLIYDQGAAGWVFLPYDLDASLEYLHFFTNDPVFWWSTRGYIGTVGDHYKVVIDDPTLRAQYVDAVATAAATFDVAMVQSWFDAWSAQIRDAVAADPHRPAMTGVDDFDDAVALGRGGVAKRVEYLGSWVACKRGGSGADADGDGYRFCEDCRDDKAGVNPGASEVCGNGADDNCNGRFDEGCPPPPPPPPDPNLPPPGDPTTPAPPQTPM